MRGFIRHSYNNNQHTSSRKMENDLQTIISYFFSSVKIIVSRFSLLEKTSIL